jgi:aryl-alcohol dehydrogenase-like predicted oxidoreductase
VDTIDLFYLHHADPREDGIDPAARRLGVGLVPYSPSAAGR